MSPPAGFAGHEPPVIGLAQRCLAAGYPPVLILRHDAPAFVMKGEKRQKQSPGKQPHGGQWARKEQEVYGATPATVARWRRFDDLADYPGVGIACGDVAGVDIDVYEPALADAIEALAVRLLGATALRRVGQAPKRLLVYRVAGDGPLHKTQTPELRGGGLDGPKAKVEVLGHGQQFVAFGIHPVTGRPFAWDEATPETTPLVELPAVAREQVEAFVAEAERLLRAAGYRTKAEIEASARAEPAAPPPRPAGATRPGNGHDDASPFKAVNDEALRRPEAWVPALFGTKARRHVNGAWRVTSRDLGRDLEEDLSIMPTGIVDFGEHDQGDPRQGKRTPIDLVMEHGGAPDAKRAAEWLAERLGMTLEIGRRGRPANGQAGPEASDQPGEGGEAPGAAEPIRVRAGELHHVAADAAAALGRATRSRPFTGFYRRGDMLARTVRLADAAELGRAGVRRARGALVIAGAEPNGLRLALTATTRWERFDGRSKDWVAIDAPADVAKALIATAPDWSEIPILTGIVEAPALRPDGTVLDRPGYDPATGLLFDPGGLDFPRVPERPTRAEALAALESLTGILAGFPFVDGASKAVAVSAIITPLVRKACRAVPLHAFTAPKMASGKTLLATLPGYIATGRAPAMMSQADDPAEERKRLLAVLIEGAALAVVDNVERELRSDALCTVLTEPSFSDRLLGVSRTVTAASAATFLATGNNLVLAGDLTARSVSCALDPGVERPEERAFEVNLHKVVPEHRGELAAAALTIVRAYLAAGEPDVDVPNFARFEDWSRFVRKPLVWLGMEDPCKGRERVEGRDPVRAQLGGLLEAWQAVFGADAMTVAQAVEEAVRDPRTQEDQAATTTRKVLREALAEVAGRRGGIDGRSAGAFIAKSENRIEGGLRFQRRGTLHKVTRWCVDGGLGGLGGLSSSRPRKMSEETDSYVNERETNPPNPHNPPSADSAAEPGEVEL